MADNSPVGMIWNGLLWVPTDSKKAPSKSSRYKPTNMKSKIGLSKADPLGKFLPNIAKDVSSIKASLFSLVKIQDQEKKQPPLRRRKKEHYLTPEGTLKPNLPSKTKKHLSRTKKVFWKQSKMV